MKNTISNQPPKGMNDWRPSEYKIRKRIFDTWRQVCLSYGYEEYLTPVVENADIYRAKSGADVGGKELMVFTDQGGRELAIRPEMTPSVVRMLSQYYQSASKPVRLFSIANFVRNEKPQRGRNREFWQLNFDVFGIDSINADIEIAQIALDIMLAFGAPRDSFRLYFNNRKLIDAVLDIADVKEKVAVVRILDKKEKLSKNDFEKMLAEIGLKKDAIEKIQLFMTADKLDNLLDSIPELKENKGLEELVKIKDTLENLGYGDLIEFRSDIIRGFDYYDGFIFEVFDRNLKNARAIFGGGRYNGLSNIFGISDMPAVGCAPGDETMRLFLESWNLLADQNLEKKYYLPIISENLQSETLMLAKKLRNAGMNIEVGLEVIKIGKALELANKKNIDVVIIFGEDEVAKGEYKLKDMKTGGEEVVNSNF